MSKYGWPRNHVLFELPEVEGRAYYNWALESDPWGALERDSDGYIAQEYDRIKGR